MRPLESLMDSTTGIYLVSTQSGSRYLIVWLDDMDDDEGYIDDADNWVEGCDVQTELTVRLGIPVLRLRPLTHLGLTPDHMARVRSFLT